jgi:hypothetical protein
MFLTFDAGKYIEVKINGSTAEKFIYNNSDQLIKIEEYEDSKVSHFSDFLYDSNGNCIISTHYNLTGSNYILEQIVEFEYGNYKNPYYSLGLPPLFSEGWLFGIFMSYNNITKIRDQIEEYHGTWFYHYSSFNENGYPLTVTMTDSLNNLIGTENIEYICP